MNLVFLPVSVPRFSENILYRYLPRWPSHSFAAVFPFTQSFLPLAFHT